jgi:hypothetical protein
MKKSILFLLSMVKDLLSERMDDFDREHLEQVVELLEQILETR